MDLKLLVKRGALIAAANWQAVAIQFVAKTTFHALLAVPLLGAAVLVTALLGADLGHLIQGSMQEIFQGLVDALTAAPVALAAFIVSFAIVVLGGSVLMFLVKGGTMEVLLASDAVAGPFENETLTIPLIRDAGRFSVDRFTAGCRRLFSRYLRLGSLLIVVYAVSAGGFLAFVFFGYQAVADRTWLLAWTVITAGAAALMVIWITVVNLVYLLVQIVMAAEDTGVFDAARTVAGLIRGEFRRLGGLFVFMLVVIAAATLASALAWSGLGLIAFIPIVGLAVIPLQLAALAVRGLAFEYIGLTAAGAYATLYRQRQSATRPVMVATASSASHPAS